MPWWGWIIIVVALVLFIPFKAKMTKKFLERQTKKREEETLDD